MDNDDRIAAREADEVIRTETASVRYHRTTETYLAEHEWETGWSHSAALPGIVKAISDVDSADRQPLFASVDPDALDRLFEPIGDDERGRLYGQIVFPCSEFLVTVHADGETVLRPRQEDSERS